MIIRSATVTLLLLLSVVQSRGQQTTTTQNIDGINIQMGTMADSPETVQWKILAARNGVNSREALRSKAHNSLADAGRLEFKFQRVEVTGVMSTDDSQEAAPGMFDKQVKPSHLNDVLPSQHPWLDQVRSLFAFGHDMSEALSDTSGIPTERGKDIISQLKGVRVNELIAHSWGTEAVYLGILNGEIIPPKRLIIVGVPESKEEKWLMLAKYTGIEVHVVGFEWDKLKAAGNITLKFRSGLPENSAKLEELWRMQCELRKEAGCADPAKFVRTKFDYNVGIRPPDAPKDEFFRTHLSKLDHDRMLYYRYLHDRNLFNKTVEQLDEPQQKLVTAEENRILSEAMKTANSFIARAKQQSFQQGFDEMVRREQAIRQAQELQANSVQTPAAAPVDAHPTMAIPFARILPKVKDFAVASCRSPGQVPLPADITRQAWSIFFNPTADARESDRLSAGLGECERLLFRRLIAEILRGNGHSITNQWVGDMAKAYTPPPPAPEVYRPPYSPRPSQPREPGCFVDEHGIRGCPVK